MDLGALDMAASGSQVGPAGMPQISEAKMMRLKEVWNKIKSHPRFEECDMDDLCRELSQKVRCDGSMPVMDANESPCELLKSVVEATADRNKKSDTQKTDPEPVHVSPSSAQLPSVPIAPPCDYFISQVGNTPVATMLEPTTAQQQQEQEKKREREMAVLAVQQFLKAYAEGGGTATDDDLEMLKRQLQGGPQAPGTAAGGGSGQMASFGQAMDLSGDGQASRSTVHQQQPRPQQQQVPASFLSPEASWSNMLLDAPSPGTQFMNMLNSAATGAGDPNTNNTNPIASLLMRGGEASANLGGMMSQNSYFGFNPSG